MSLFRALNLGILVALLGARGSAAAEAPSTSCTEALDELGVEYRRVKKRDIELGVEVLGPLGGVSYRGYSKGPLILDCSLVVSLAKAGPLLARHGIGRATYSSAYQRRRIRGSTSLSQHSYGLAIDLHTFHGAGEGELFDVRDDYEQGLGDHVDCVGTPLTDAGRVLRTAECELRESALFELLLSPDYDVDHYNHFHLEALPWARRPPAL